MKLGLDYKVEPSVEVLTKILEKLYHNPFIEQWEKVAFSNPDYSVDTICYTKKTHQTGEWEVLENAPVVEDLDDIDWAKEHDIQLIAKSIYLPQWEACSFKMYGDFGYIRMMVNNKSKFIRFDLFFEDDFAKDKTAAILDYAWEMYRVVEGDNMFLIHHNFKRFYHFATNDIIEPPSGMSIFWATVEKKSSYQKYVDKSALLSMPAYEVKELENDSVFIQYYEDPWEYDSPEAIEYQRQCSAHIIEHLNSDWDEWKALLPS